MLARYGQNDMTLGHKKSITRASTTSYRTTTHVIKTLINLEVVYDHRTNQTLPRHLLGPSPCGWLLKAQRLRYCQHSLEVAPRHQMEGI